MTTKNTVVEEQQQEQQEQQEEEDPVLATKKGIEYQSKKVVKNVKTPTTNPDENKVIDEIKISETMYGTKWFKTVMKAEIKARHIKDGYRVICPKEKCIAHMQKKQHTLLMALQNEKGFYSFGSYKDANTFINVLEDTKPKERHFFEVIHGASKLVADIEGNLNDYPVKKVIKKVNTLFQQAFEHFGYDKFDKSKMKYCNASQEGEYTETTYNNDTKQFETKTKQDKMSLHVIYDGDVGTHNIVEQKAFFEYIKELQRNDEWGLYMKQDKRGYVETSVFDISIYSTDRSYRTVLSAKNGSKRYLRPCDANGDRLEEYNTIDYICQYNGDNFLQLPIVERYKTKHIKDSVSGSSVEYVSNVAINEAIKVIKNVTFDAVKGNLILLKNVGVRTCIIGGETNESDNCYLVNKRTGLYFRCHDEGCVGKDKCVYSYREYKTMEAVSINEVFNFLPEQVELFRHLCKGTDTEIVDMFRMLYGGRIISITDEVLYYWNGQYWKEGNTSIIKNLLAQVVKKRIFKLVADLLYKLKKECNPENEKTNKLLDKEITEFGKHFARIGSISNQKSVCDGIMTDLRNEEFEKTLDVCPYLRTFKNGVVNLQTGELLSFSPDMYLSKFINFDYKTEFDDKVVNAYKLFLDNITLGNKQLEDFIQEMIGYCLTGEISEQCTFFLNGEGSNGKSALTDLIKKAFGMNYWKGTKKLIIGGLSNNNNDQLKYMLKGVSLCCVEESCENEKLDDGTIKELTGTSELTARPLYRMPITFPMTAKIMLCTNHLPVINSKDRALTRRLIVIPFNTIFCDKTPKTEGEVAYDAENALHRLKDKACVDTTLNNIEYFIWWVIGGTKRWYSRGQVGDNGKYVSGSFVVPECVKMKTNEFFKENDTFGQFMDEYCELGKDKFTATNRLFQKYKFYYSDAITERAFANMLSKRGFEIGSKRINGIKTKVRIGIALTEDQSDNSPRFD